MINQKGFTLVEGLVIVLVFAVVGFGGYAVWDRSQGNESKNTNTITTNNELSSEEDIENENENQNQTVTDSWTTFVSTKGWSVKLPDGWDVLTNMDGDGFWISSTPRYLQGVPALIEVTDGGRGGPFALNSANFATGDPATQIPQYLTNELDFSGANVNGKRYSGTLAQDYPLNGSAGDTIYSYIFPGDTKTVVFWYNDFKDPNSDEVLDLLEKSLATFTMN